MYPLFSSKSSPQSLGKDVTVSNFSKEVLEASTQKVVILDFWAPSCNPCKQLTPLLEKLVQKYPHQLVLAKINVEDQQELALQFRIQSVPTIYFVVNGQPVDGFMGSVSESHIEKMIQKWLSPLPAQDVTKDLIKAGEEAFYKGDFQISLQAFQDCVSATPKTEFPSPSLFINLIRSLVFNQRLEQAEQIYLQIPDSANAQKQSAAALFALYKAGQSSFLQDSPTTPEHIYQNAMFSFTNGQFQLCMQHLSEIVSKHRDWQNDKGRLTLIQVFEALGENHPEVIQGRKQLALILFK